MMSRSRMVAHGGRSRWSLTMGHDGLLRLNRSSCVAGAPDQSGWIAHAGSEVGELLGALLGCADLQLLFFVLVEVGRITGAVVLWLKGGFDLMAMVRRMAVRSWTNRFAVRRIGSRSVDIGRHRSASVDISRHRSASAGSDNTKHSRTGEERQREMVYNCVRGRQSGARANPVRTCLVRQLSGGRDFERIGFKWFETEAETNSHNSCRD